jgi:hypothetical protein
VTNKALLAVTVRLKGAVDDVINRVEPDRRDEGLSSLEWIIITVGAAAIATLVVVAYKAVVNQNINLLKGGK